LVCGVITSTLVRLMVSTCCWARSAAGK
jgi:hypothetical protein